MLTNFRVKKYNLFEATDTTKGTTVNIQIRYSNHEKLRAYSIGTVLDNW
jgi:hypothetical protein